MPSMDEHIRNRVMKALLERGEKFRKFKNHWYKCTQCGYTFFTGDTKDDLKLPTNSQDYGAWSTAA